MNRKRIFPVLIAFLLLAGPGISFAQRGAVTDEPFWMTLERGKLLFREKRYGDALLSFEDALRGRRELFARHRRALVDALSLPEVRRFDDSLTRFETYAAERKLKAAQDALAAVYALVPRDSMNGSALAAMDAALSLAAYPEAEYWIGEAYRAEGESAIALKQYQKAYALRDLLEVHDEGRDILYKIAELQAERLEYPAMEASLLEILKEDILWTSGSSAFIRDAMSRTLADEGLDRFLLLYRYSSPWALRAHRDLGLYFYRSGRHDRAAAHLTFAFLIQVTVLIDEIKRSESEWKATTLPDILDRAEKRESAVEYLADTGFYRTVYYFGASLYAVGRGKSAIELWRAVANR
ncbi:MAG: hypothetical protein A2Z99_05120, partial [Treponema sp. GWB1_62_6]